MYWRALLLTVSNEMVGIESRISRRYSKAIVHIKNASDSIAGNYLRLKNINNHVCFQYYGNMNGLID